MTDVAYPRFVSLPSGTQARKVEAKQVFESEDPEVRIQGRLSTIGAWIEREGFI